MMKMIKLVTTANAALQNKLRLNITHRDELCHISRSMNVALKDGSLQCFIRIRRTGMLKYKYSQTMMNK